MSTIIRIGGVGYSIGYDDGYSAGHNDGSSSVKKIKKVVSYAKWRNSDHEHTNGFTIEFNEDGSVKDVSASIDGYGIPSSSISKTVDYY